MFKYSCKQVVSARISVCYPDYVHVSEKAVFFQGK